MKKLILTSLALITLASFASARTADRHGLEAPDPLPVATVQAPAPVKAVPAESPVEKAKAPVVSPAAKTEAATEVAKSACPLAENAKCAAGKQFTTALGINYVSVGASVSVTSAVGIDPLGAGAKLEGSLNVYKSCDDVYGLNLAVPLSYDYTSVSDALNLHQFTFPIYARPYYRFFVGEDVVITPYADCGVGGMYAYEGMTKSSDDMFFVWAVGGGVEISFLKDFSFTPKYSYSNIESKPSSYYQSVGAEFTWKFTCNMAVSAEYQHYFMEEGEIAENIAIVKVRYEF